MIKLENVSKTFKVAIREKGIWNAIRSLFRRKYVYKEALKDVSFSIGKGEIVGYIGPNGAGKSTTIKIMSGILSPTSGKCEIDGCVPWKERIKFVKRIGAVFGQRSNLNWDVPVIDSYELLKDIYKIPQEEYDHNLELLSEKLQLKEFLGVPLRQLSLGQRMRCEIAGALLHSPSILFLDEPTIGLDAISKLAVRDFIKDINRETKVTVILTTHDMTDIEALTNRVILIGKGHLLYNGSFDAIKKKYAKKKVLTVEFLKEYEKPSLRGYKLIEVSGNTAIFETTSEDFNMAEFAHKISKKYEVQDINLKYLSTEEIISNLYKEFGI